MTIVTGFLLPLGLAATKGIRRFVGVIQNRRQAHELSHWDDRALKDIGLTRSDLSGAFSLPLRQDPTLHLAALAGRSPRASSEEMPRMGEKRVAESRSKPGSNPSNRPAFSA
jgi:uncharacterized protein YjiS (DUF1127 family)